VSRLIDADSLKEDLTRFYDGEVTARQLIDEQPTVEPERRLGKWVAVGECYVKCSECGLETTKNELRGIALFGENEPYFCPNCGADMRGQNENE
jgi:hypothetical protein